jgi:hypothetical protein
MTRETESLPLFKYLIFTWEDNVKMIRIESGKIVRFDGASSKLLSRAKSDVIDVEVLSGSATGELISL